MSLLYSVIGAMFKEKENPLFYWRKAKEDWAIATTPQPNWVTEGIVVLPVSSDNE